MISKDVNSKEILESGIRLESVLSYLKTDSPKVSQTVYLLKSVSNCSVGNVKELKEIKKGSKDWLSKIENEKLSKEDKLPDLIIDDLKDNILNWRTKFKAALEDSFINFPQVDFPIEKLRDGPSGILSTEANKKLNESERRGLREACYSLLAENYTSLELISLRTVSSILQRWYEKKTGGKINGSWTTILEKLANEYPDKKPRELSLLEYLIDRKKELMNTSRISTKSDAETTLSNVFNIAEKTKNPRPKTY